MDDADALPEDIGPVSEALHQAILIQRYKANKSNLEKLIREAEKIDLSIYTKESADILKAALDEARTVMADETLSEDEQAQVDETAQALKEAIDALEPDQPGENTPAPTPGTPANDDTDRPSGENAQTSAGADTGDSFQAGLWVLIFGAAAALLAGSILIKRKRG